RAELESGAVLNGIAYDPENDVFLITGKLWPKMFEVRFVEQEQ
ncbi:MAG: glutaminyl-peptide cyclotransferase, partial [Chloroflexi bacterium]|nr:glutaminyl-peptide cyclotransferase [Chloroflexota bacterium]